MPLSTQLNCDQFQIAGKRFKWPRTDTYRKREVSRENREVNDLSEGGENNLESSNPQL